VHAYGFSKGQDQHDSFHSMLIRIQDEKCFFIHHLKNGALPYNVHKDIFCIGIFLTIEGCEEESSYLQGCLVFG